MSGHLFVFINRRATQMKVLYWDRTGFCVWAKRLEEGRFLSDWTKVATREMDWTRLKLLLEVIELAAPETAGLAADEYEVIGHKESYRLAQRPGSYVVLKYRRPVVKLKATEEIVSAQAPRGVIEGILRVLQCVAASGKVCVVSSTKRARSTFAAGAPRGKSRSIPASRFCA